MKELGREKGEGGRRERGERGRLGGRRGRRGHRSLGTRPLPDRLYWSRRWDLLTIDYRL